MVMFQSHKRFSFFYFGVMLVYMLSIVLGNQVLHNITKPVFMVLLVIYYRTQLGALDKFSKLILLGLFFSWLGDIFLMIEKTGLFFILGLGSFLIAHLGYLGGFYQNLRSSKEPFNYGKSVLYSIPFLLITVPFFLYIKSGVPSELFMPVFAYTAVITAMGIFSALRFGHVNQKTFNWVLIGAILFIFSDCVLAINLFSIQPETGSHLAKGLAICNMFLYLTGQYYITRGAVYNRPLL